MKLFHISDVLTLTTGHLVSNRHLQGVYDLLKRIITNNNSWRWTQPLRDDDIVLEWEQPASEVSR